MPILISPDRMPSWLSAIDRAETEGVRLWRTKSGWRGRKMGGAMYDLYARESDAKELTVTCSCPGFGYRSVCKHAIHLAQLLHQRGETVKL
jgi:hypothetical protein